jgi:two-component system phosphate regulon sensor histidine kinase PhoR
VAARIFLKLIAAVLCVLVVALVAVDFLASRLVESTYLETRTREMAEKGRLLVAMSGGHPARLSQAELESAARAAGARITLVAEDGRVLADSGARAERMENHRNRPEFRAALAGRQGVSIRASATIGVNFLYVAQPVPGGALRLAVLLSEIDDNVNAVRRKLLAATGLAFLPAIILAAWIARGISARMGGIIEYAGQLAQGNFAARMTGSGKHELGVLIAKLNETGEKLQAVFEQLRRERQELQHMETIRKDFIINVSHELRTPLASIQGYTETLLDGALQDQQNNVRFLGIIQQNAGRLSRLITDIMTLSRVELKTQRFQFAAYRACDLLRQAIDTMQPAAEKKHIRLELGPTADGAEAFCDAEAFHQIMVNLLDNGISYTPANGSVVVTAQPAPPAAGQPEMVEVRVRDTGIGIPEADQPRLFERFYRVDKARSREMGGTGLGLAIVKHLVRAQGGEVHVESRPGKGSTFVFTLPVHDLGLAEGL